MITYEVTVEVEKAMLAKFDVYMTEEHIPDVVATGSFLTARYFAAGERRRTVYEAADKETLDRFPVGVSLTREIWQLIAPF